MKNSWWLNIRCLHEWPLIGFTSLAIPACGMFAVTLLTDVAHLYVPGNPFLEVAALLVLGGVVLSFLHLGRPSRAPLALSRLGRNVLSTEVALASAIAICALAPVVVRLDADTVGFLARAVTVLAFGLLANLGVVYCLKARGPWRGVVSLVPLTLGLACGFVFSTVTARGGLSSPRLALLLLALDCFVFCRYAATLSRNTAESMHAAPAHPIVFVHRRSLTFMRVVLVNLVPAILLVAGLEIPATVSLALGVLVDRFAFYGLAIAVTTEASVGHVEDAIRASFTL